MGKLKCICGHIITDQIDNLEYKGYILPDKYVDEVSDLLTDKIDSLIDAIKSQNRLSWIKENFLTDYPINLEDSSMIHDLLLDKLSNTTQDIFECDNCGRIAIEVGQTNKFKFYIPEEREKVKGILSGKKSPTTKAKKA